MFTPVEKAKILQDYDQVVKRQCSGTLQEIKDAARGIYIGENINETSKSALCSTLMESYKRSRNAHCS